jgi:hypothetical protein
MTKEQFQFNKALEITDLTLKGFGYGMEARMAQMDGDTKKYILNRTQLLTVISRIEIVKASTFESMEAA